MRIFKRNDTSTIFSYFLGFKFGTFSFHSVCIILDKGFTIDFLSDFTQLYKLTIECLEYNFDIQLRIKVKLRNTKIYFFFTMYHDASIYANERK